MALGKCPICGQTGFYSVRDIEAWQHHPTDDQGFVLVACFRCWKKLKVGDQVSVRNRPEAVTTTEETAKKKIGIADKGTVVEISKIPSGEEIIVVNCELPNGKTKWVAKFQRHNLFYESQKASVGSKSDGIR